MPVLESGRARAEGGIAGPAWPLFCASHSSPFARQPGQAQFSHPGAQASSPAHDLPDREPSARSSQRDIRRPARPRLMFIRFPADFWCLWSVGLISSVVRWLETVVVGVVVYRETDSPFLVSVVTMLRLLPMACSAPFSAPSSSASLAA